MNINKAKIDIFAQKTQAMEKRITKLYENVISMPVIDKTPSQALFELANALQTLHNAIEELYQQNEELEKAQEFLEVEYQRYEELFEEAPDGYLVTDIYGMIQQANHTAAKMLKIEKQYMFGKPMINFIALENRQCFRNFLTQLNQNHKNCELVISLQQRNGNFLDTTLKVAISYDQSGKPEILRWLVREIHESRRADLLQLKKEYDFTSDRPVHKYSKGEIIPLNLQTIWYVVKGWVKLTTFCATNEEALVGLAAQGMVFASNMTSLRTYQAIALSNVELISIDLSEINSSPTLSCALLPKINQRLQQAESFLAISGFRRVQDRFYYLLQLLKQEIGKKTDKGFCLPIRLTHEDLANACCTTRVTITRLISCLKAQGKIDFDENRRIIIKNLE